MTKAELVEFVREKTGLRKVDVANAVAAVLDGVKETLVKGGKVQIVGFGTFEVRKRSARTGRNPQDPTKIVKIPEKIEAGYFAKSLNLNIMTITYPELRIQKQVAAAAFIKAIMNSDAVSRNTMSLAITSGVTGIPM